PLPPGRAQRQPKPPDVAADGHWRRPRRRRPPQRLGDRLHWHQTVGVEQQDRQQRPLMPPPYGYVHLPVAYHQRPQQAELHRPGHQPITPVAESIPVLPAFYADITGLRQSTHNGPMAVDSIVGG